MTEAPKIRYAEYAATMHNKQLGEIYTKFLKRVKPEHLRFGPTYLTTTRKGQPLELTSLLIGTNSQGDQTLLVLAQDWAGEIIGHRRVTLTKEKDHYYAKGEINTLTPGKGIAKPLELATMDLLQNIARESRLPIVWRVENGNARNLENIQKKYGQSADPDEQELVVKVEGEQVRWKGLYGKDGLLGFDYIRLSNKLERIIYPDSSDRSADLTTIDRVNLTYWQTELPRRTIGPDTYKVISGDPKQIQEAKRRKYENELEPMMQECASSPSSRMPKDMF